MSDVLNPAIALEMMSPADRNTCLAAVAIKDAMPRSVPASVTIEVTYRSEQLTAVIRMVMVGGNNDELRWDVRAGGFRDSELFVQDVGIYESAGDIVADMVAERARTLAAFAAAEDQ
jgi:hypothetical protein